MNDFKVTVLLADHAQAVNGKLYITGGGWNITGPQLSMSAIAVVVEVPWDETNRKHSLRLALRDSDAKPFMVHDPAKGMMPLEITAEFEIGRPAGITVGTPLSVPFAFNLLPMQYSPGRYEWQCTIDGRGNSNWNVAFEYRDRIPGTPQQ